MFEALRQRIAVPCGISGRGAFGFYGLAFEGKTMVVR